MDYSNPEIPEIDPITITMSPAYIDDLICIIETYVPMTEAMPTMSRILESLRENGFRTRKEFDKVADLDFGIMMSKLMEMKGADEIVIVDDEDTDTDDLLLSDGDQDES